MTAFLSGEGRRWFRFRIFPSGSPGAMASERRWRLVGVVLVVVYLAQDAVDLRWEWLHRFQSIDEFEYATGAGLFFYIGCQWYLFLVRLGRKRLLRPMVVHQRSGVFAPVLFYDHSMQIGYGYLAALSWIYLTNVVVGAANPTGLRIPYRYYTAVRIVLHVALAALTVIIALYHAYVALYYK